MAVDVRRVRHYSFDIEDKVGEGARILATLRENDVNLIALWGYPTGAGKARLEIVPEDADGFEAAAKATGLDASAPTTAFYATGDDRVGALGATLEILAKAGVTISAAHAIADGRGHFAAVVYVPPSDVQRAGTALNSR
jgi:hypothetical protein